MAQPLHILICGEIGAGKSTLIQRLLEQYKRPVYGFITKRLEADDTGFHPVYIHPADAKQRVYTQENLIGRCNAKKHEASDEVFNTLGVRYLDAKASGLIVMDELGFMESKAAAFVDKVFRALDGEVPVIAAVKARLDVPFLNEVRAHKNATLYMLNKENRDALYDELLQKMQRWDG